MSLTLEISSRTLLSSTSHTSVTVFSPTDSAFSSAGQPSLSLLRYHVSPGRLTPGILRSFPYAARIPTLSPNCTVILTSFPSPHSSASPISLNGVNVDISAPIYDDGSFLIYATDHFFDPTFRILSASSSSGGCRATHPPRPFVAAVSEMSSRGFSSMASFLDLQLSGGGSKGPDNPLRLTVFAPLDGALGNGDGGGFRGFTALLRAHVVPCRLSMEQLAEMEEGTSLPTLLDGFAIEVGRVNGMVVLNGVPVHKADVYVDDTLVVHGVRQLLEAPGSVSIDFGSSGGRRGRGGG